MSSTWWDNPEANPLQDMRDYLEWIRDRPTPEIQPCRVPEWMQRRWGIDEWGNPMSDQGVHR